MLLTIHNLPSSTRYADVKSLLKDKCGLTDIIVDNLTNEGKNKKVTVGLASENDGAIVVRKLNGMFINGQQLYIEDRRRPTADQPYRPAEFEAASHSMGQPAIPVWNQQAPTSYNQPMAVDQNLLAYSGYGVAPQVTHFMKPQPVSAELPRYSGYQAEAYAPNNPPRNQESGDWGVNTRDQVSDTSRHKDRKRRHSPDRPAAARKRASRFDNFNEAKNSRGPSPPRQQWDVEKRASQDQVLRSNQNVEPNYLHREPNSDNRHRDPEWTNPRWDESKPPEEDQHWGNDNRDMEPQPTKVWDNQPQQWREESRRWDNQQKPQWACPPKPQWESPPKTRWESPPKPRWESPPKPRWESSSEPHWNNQPKPQWDSPQKPQRSSPPKSQWDNQPKPQWEDRIPVENIRSEWYDHLASSDTSRGNDRDFQPQDRDRYNDSRSRNKGYNEPINDPIWNREPDRTFSSSGREARPREDGRGQRSRSRNGRQGRDDWRDRPVTSRDRSGGRQNPNYGKPKDYPSREFIRQTKPQRDAPKATQNYETPRHEKEKVYNRQNTNSNRFVQEKKTYPPVSVPQVTKPVQGRYETNKPQTLRSMINKDQSNRGQATALLAKKVYGLGSNTPFQAKSPLDAFIFKQLKVCVKSRIDVLFGEELSVHMGDVLKRYRSKYPIEDDKTLKIQISEKSTKEFEALPSRTPKEKVLKDGAANVTEVAKEKSDAEQNKADSKTVEIKKESANEKDETPAPVKKLPEPPVPPSVRRLKPGQPLTDKQVIQQMKLLRKWEYDQDDLYSLDEVTARSLDNELAELDKLFSEECANPVDQQEALICKRITTDSLNDLNKTIRLYISKRFLNIQTGLAIRMFAAGKPPKKEAVLQYLKKHKIQAAAVKKSVKGAMFMINVTKFDDFDVLCNIENDVIDDIPVTFKAMHLIGPPPKISKNQIKSMRQKTIEDQIQGVDMDELEDMDFGGKGDVAETGAGAANGKTDVVEEDFAKDDFSQAEDFSKDIGVTLTGEDFSKDFVEEVNIDNINEEDLEDF